MTEDAFLSLLPTLGFLPEGGILTKWIGSTRLMVDLATKSLLYPEEAGLIVNERQTCNFSQSENFVVFECVHRLLLKGYLPRHIELEPKWKVGHGASGGRADILIRDNHGHPLLIIECKTAGREFTKAWNDTLRDGDQLFSYAQQISGTQFLCLYTSFIEDGELHYTSNIIAHRDNERYLADNPTFRGFKDAADVKDRFGVWKDTYKLDYTPGGIFEENIQPYHIGKDKYTLSDLHPISASDQQKQYHRFATILRQHNVSGRENAFDKLVNLFLCKLVDETENPDDLKFYWKGVAYDTHFELLDRLQQLYQRGMGKFLGEDITYINEGDVSNALRFIRQNPDATHRAVWNLFIQQKFFTNNDFSFIDVHNEKLFYQNAEVLLKLLQMWQDIRLVDETRHSQFLGDMFEYFLDQGVKQSEGQYFTPMPICRFLLMSLPLEAMVKGNANPPKSIDYACGAGHFLTELALQLKPLVEKHHSQRDIDDYHRAIHGIEKEYRLSKIAKVSAFMYQQPGIQICYADALVHEPDTYPEIRNGTFDLLVANPPFSVRGFLETLPEEHQRLYKLTDTISDLDTANSIEAFFLERASQLLKLGGLAAIILPASILSNGGATYTRAREILLQNFDIIAIAEFGSGTFGKTATNTVTLFLRRKATNPSSVDHYRERIAEWFKGANNSKRKQVIYQDAHLIDAYASHIGIPANDYKTLLCGDPSEDLLAHEIFAAYGQDFEASNEVNRFKKQQKFKRLSPAGQAAELRQRRLAHHAAIEQDKLLHYLLSREQAQSVLILKTPTDTKERKRFLGYEWSSAKGDEGIKFTRDAEGRHITPLYDETNRDNAEKINHAIARNFLGELTAIPEALRPWLTLAPLPTLLDFSRVSFEKQINRTPQQKNVAAVESKWPVGKLGSVVDYSSDRIEASALNADTYVGVDNLMPQFGGKSPSVFVPSSGRITAYRKGDILLSNIRPYLKKIWLADNEGGASNDVLVLRAKDAGVDSKFVYIWLSQDAFFAHTMAGAKGAKMPRGDKRHILDYQVPKPPLGIQRKIVTECASVERDVNRARRVIEKARQDIDFAVNAVYASNAARHSIDSLALSIQYGLSKPMNEAGVGYKIFRMNEIASGRMVDGGFMKTVDISAKEFAVYQLKPGDILFNRTNGSFDQVGKSGLFDLAGDYCCASYLVRITPNTSMVNPLFLVKMMNSSAFLTEIRTMAVRSAGQNNINATKMRNMSIPVPALKEQERFVKKIAQLESAITASEVILVDAPGRKTAILQKYL